MNNTAIFVMRKYPTVGSGTTTNIIGNDDNVRIIEQKYISDFILRKLNRVRATRYKCVQYVLYYREGMSKIKNVAGKC
jgi:hypothetical protein